MRLRTATGVTTLALMLAGLVTGSPGPATAGPPGTWTKVSSGNVSTQSTISLVRGVDGVLHGLYGQTDTHGAHELVAVRLDIDGFVMNTTVVHGGLDSLNEFPVLTKTSTGIEAHYGAFIGGPPNPWSDGGVHLAWADDNPGTNWSVTTLPVLASSAGSSADGVGVVTLSDDTPVTVATKGSDIIYSAGVNQAVTSFSPGACCAYYATAVTDGVNAGVVWQGNGGTADTTGVFARQIHPGLGSTTYKAPKSSVDTGSGHALSMSDQPTAAVQRNDNLTWVAYPVGYPTRTSVGLWRVGDTSAKYLPGSAGARLTALATGPSGRLWVAWVVGNDTVKLVRTAPSGAALGPIRTVKKPGAATGIYQVALEATYGEVDVVINGGNGFYHTQVKPGLNFSASPKSWRRGAAKTVTFTVKDAGAPIARATVSAKGLSCRTSAAGTCSLRFPALRAGSFTATATRGSTYAPAKLTLKVR